MKREKEGDRKGRELGEKPGRGWDEKEELRQIGRREDRKENGGRGGRERKGRREGRIEGRRGEGGIRQTKRKERIKLRREGFKYRRGNYFSFTQDHLT